MQVRNLTAILVAKKTGFSRISMIKRMPIIVWLTLYFVFLSITNLTALIKIKHLIISIYLVISTLEKTGFFVTRCEPCFSCEDLLWSHKVQARNSIATLVATDKNFSGRSVTTRNANNWMFNPTSPEDSGRVRCCGIGQNRCTDHGRARGRRSFGKAAILPISADSGVFFSPSGECPARPRQDLHAY